MISTNLPSVLVATLLISTASAQTVSVNLGAATPLTATTNFPTPQTTTQPAGPLPNSGQIESVQGSNSARNSWLSVSGPTKSQVWLTNDLQGQASTGPHEIVIEWTASSPVDVYIELSASLTASAGTPVPQIAIDVGNTGSLSPINATSVPVTFGPYTLTTQPLPVRIQFSNTLASGFSFSNLGIAVKPNNNLIITPFGTGCLGDTMQLSAQFEDTGIIAQDYQPYINIPTVLVVGLAAQPVALPPLFGTQCLLLPRPDVFVLFHGVPSIAIPLPAAVRPVALWVQRGGIAFGQLVTSNAYHVNAF